MATATPTLLGSPNLTVTLASGDALDVREFRVEEGLSRLFDIQLIAVSDSPDVDFESAIGASARFEIHRTSEVDGETRHWGGVCARLEQVGVEERGVSTYLIRIVPSMWLLTQRRNYRIFQDKSELDGAQEILAEWGINPRLELDAGSYEKRRYRVQYAESDFDFVCRMLEDAGIAYHFEQSGGDSRLVLVDSPNRRSSRAPLPFVSTPNERMRIEYVTGVQTAREVKPGRYTQSDVDFRKALDYPLAASATKGGSIETKLERYHHNYGAFLWKGGGGDTPVADDRGAARTNEGAGAQQVSKRLDAQRVEARACSFRTSAYDLHPGQVITIIGHPRAEIGSPLLLVGGTLRGTATGEYNHHVDARYADVDFRPAMSTPKPRTLGVESATVTGPAGEEIHCDEFGRVRAHFHWDRQGSTDENSSCWIPVSQPWAGAGFGAISLPRVGQEVLVDFLGADPDRPMILGRVFTKTTPPPYELPKYKMVSGMRSESYPRAKGSAPQARMGGGPALALIDPGPEATPATPAGGGPRLVSLGGGDGGGGGSSQSFDASRIMPGPHGAKAAPPIELDDAVSRARALGPDEVDTKRSANGIVTDDTAAEEKLYLQAQKDLRIAVKNNLVGGIGANRAFKVLGNDHEDIKGYQGTEVTKDRTVEVTGIQSHTVKGDIFVKGLSSHIVNTTADYMSHTDGAHLFDAKVGIVLQVDKSCVALFPGAIVIDSPKVFINPGDDFMNALKSGKSPAEAADIAAREARINKGAAAVAKFMTDRGFDKAPQFRNNLQHPENGLREMARTEGGLQSDAEVTEAMRRADAQMPR